MCASRPLIPSNITRRQNRILLHELERSCKNFCCSLSSVDACDLPQKKAHGAKSKRWQCRTGHCQYIRIALPQSPDKKLAVVKL